MSNFQRLGFLSESPDWIQSSASWAFRVLERVAGLDAEQRLVGLRVLVTQIVDIARGDEREAGLLRELCELGIDARLLGEPGVLDLDVDVVPAEHLRQPVEV